MRSHQDAVRAARDIACGGSEPWGHWLYDVSNAVITFNTGAPPATAYNTSGTVSSAPITTIDGAAVPPGRRGDINHVVDTVVRVLNAVFGCDGTPALQRPQQYLLLLIYEHGHDVGWPAEGRLQFSADDFRALTANLDCARSLLPSDAERFLFDLIINRKDLVADFTCAWYSISDMRFAYRSPMFPSYDASSDNPPTPPGALDIRELIAFVTAEIRNAVRAPDDPLFLTDPQKAVWDVLYRHALEQAPGPWTVTQADFEAVKRVLAEFRGRLLADRGLSSALLFELIFNLPGGP